MIKLKYLLILVAFGIVSCGGGGEDEGESGEGGNAQMFIESNLQSINLTLPITGTSASVIKNTNKNGKISLN